MATMATSETPSRIDSPILEPSFPSMVPPSSSLEAQAVPQLVTRKSTPLVSPFETPQSSPTLAAAVPLSTSNAMQAQLTALMQAHFGENTKQQRVRVPSDLQLPSQSGSLSPPASPTGSSSLPGLPLSPPGSGSMKRLQVLLQKLGSPMIAASVLSALLALVLLSYCLVPSTGEQVLHQRSSGIRGLAHTVHLALKSEVEIDVEVTSGNVELSREKLFVFEEGRSAYSEYAQHEQRFFKKFKAAFKKHTKARNLFIAKADSLFKVEDEVCRLSIRFSGAVNIEYIAVAFNGGGFIDRRGKPGGHKNWSIRGFYQRDEQNGPYADFFDKVEAKKRNLVDSCDIHEASKSRELNLTENREKQKHE
eukprot:TRINITY_DN22548_c0_g1_i1.p1 TRINITY_DN22548_c0_g1~~TRINITY_DN22548_c0_g1_i1.p1  ORF type:complete len:373 (+),score=61.87 TRINITY_DN22548_c0_g1_i1:32-1120(+)